MGHVPRSALVVPVHREALSAPAFRVRPFDRADLDLQCVLAALVRLSRLDPPSDLARLAALAGRSPAGLQPAAVPFPGSAQAESGTTAAAMGKRVDNTSSR